jgi:hypothetical protein
MHTRSLRERSQVSKCDCFVRYSSKMSHVGASPPSRASAPRRPPRSLRRSATDPSSKTDGILLPGSSWFRVSPPGAIMGISKRGSQRLRSLPVHGARCRPEPHHPKSIPITPGSISFESDAASIDEMHLTFEPAKLLFSCMGTRTRTGSIKTSEHRDNVPLHSLLPFGSRLRPRFRSRFLHIRI